MRRVLRSLALVLLLAAVVIPSCVAVRSRDLPDPGDADLLAVPRAGSAAGAHAYADLQAAAAALDYPTQGGFDVHVSVLRGEQEPDARFAEVHGRHAAALAAVRRVLAAEQLALPVRSVGDDSFLQYQLLAKLLAIEAQLLARQGRTRASLQASLEVVDLGQRMVNADGGALIAAMTGTSMKQIGSESLRGSLRHLRVAPADAHWAAEALDAQHSDPASWSRMWALEYQSWKHTLDAVFASRDLTPISDDSAFHPMQLLPDAYTYQHNRTLAEFAEHYRELQRASALRCAQFTDAHRVSKWSMLARVLDRNGAGTVLIAIARPNYWTFEFKRCLSETALAATQAQLGLRAYQLEHGELPDALQALVPAYLPELPRDGFDGEPLRYSRAARRLHSPGSDLIDRGGDAERREGMDFLREPTYPIRF